MTVFRGFIKLALRQLHMLLLYVAVFVTIAVIVQLSLREERTDTFEMTSLPVAVEDRDGGAAAEGLKEYLGQIHRVTEWEGDLTGLQEKMFYRDIYYLVRIPENFEAACLAGQEKLEVTKIPGTTSAYYVDSQISAWLREMKAMLAAGYGTQEACALVLQAQSGAGSVRMLDESGYGGEPAPHAFLFQYLPYMVLSILCYGAAFIMIAFRKEEVRRRLLVSPVPRLRQNLGLMAGYLVLGAVVWVISLILPVTLYRGDFLSDGNLPYYMANVTALVLVSLSIAYVIGMLVKNADIVNGVVNVVTLGMCFLCGVFVSMDVLAEGVRRAAAFLPVYWYETVNGILSDHASLTAGQRAEVLQGLGLQLLFAAALFGVGMAVSRYRETD